MGQGGGLCKTHPNLGEVWIQALMARARRASAGALGVIYWRALQVARVLALPAPHLGPSSFLLDWVQVIRLG